MNNFEQPQNDDDEAFNQKETSKPTYIEILDERRKKELEDLVALADVLNIEIIREEIFGGVQSIVVEGKDGKEVRVGFPDGTHNPHYSWIAYPPVATDRIAGIQMRPYGHGIWEFEIMI